MSNNLDLLYVHILSHIDIQTSLSTTQSSNNLTTP